MTFGTTLAIIKFNNYTSKFTVRRKPNKSPNTFPWQISITGRSRTSLRSVGTDVTPKCQIIYAETTQERENKLLQKLFGLLYAQRYIEMAGTAEFTWGVSGNTQSVLYEMSLKALVLTWPHTKRECAVNMAVWAYTELACLLVRIASVSGPETVSPALWNSFSWTTTAVFWCSLVKRASWKTLVQIFVQKILRQRCCVKTDVRKRRQWWSWQTNLQLDIPSDIVRSELGGQVNRQNNSCWCYDSTMEFVHSTLRDLQTVRAQYFTWPSDSPCTVLYVTFRQSVHSTLRDLQTVREQYFTWPSGRTWCVLYLKSMQFVKIPLRGLRCSE